MYALESFGFGFSRSKTSRNDQKNSLHTSKPRGCRILLDYVGTKGRNYTQKQAARAWSYIFQGLKTIGCIQSSVVQDYKPLPRLFKLQYSTHYWAFILPINSAVNSYHLRIHQLALPTRLSWSIFFPKEKHLSFST